MFLLVLFLRICCQTQSHPGFLLDHFQEVLWFCALHFKSMVHFEVILGSGVRSVSRLIFFCLQMSNYYSSIICWKDYMFYRREWKTPELTISQMTSIYRARIKENNLHTSRKDLQLKTKRRNHEMGRRGRHSKDSFSKQATHKRENNHSCRGSPPGGSGLNPTSGFPALGGPVLGRLSPRTSSFADQWGL